MARKLKESTLLFPLTLGTPLVAQPAIGVRPAAPGRGPLQPARGARREPMKRVQSFVSRQRNR
jgi:hypothetical protein